MCSVLLRTAITRWSASARGVAAQLRFFFRGVLFRDVRLTGDPHHTTKDMRGDFLRSVADRSQIFHCPGSFDLLPQTGRGSQEQTREDQEPAAAP